MHSKRHIDALSLTSAALWLKITKEVSWAYRLKKIHAPTLGFVLGVDYLPSKSVWDNLRKEVNKQRRNTRARLNITIASKAADKKREYMRLYMQRKRRERAKKLPKRLGVM